MKKPMFIGSCVAIVTPFTENGIDFDKLEQLIEFQIKEGTDALAICATTGEASTMPDEEHISAVKFAVDIVKKRIPVIAGAGSNDTHHAIYLSKKSEEVGSDGILSVTPYYNKTSQRGLYQHFKMIAESVKIPVILYNVPSRTNLNIIPETIKDLSTLPNIVAIKECNLAQMGEVSNLCGDDLTIYSGEDGQILPALTFGAKGVISVMANIIPKDTHDMVIKFLNGDLQAAIQLNLKTVDLCKSLFIDVNPIPVKAAMNLMGMGVGCCRMPLVDTSEKNLEYIKNSLIKYGLIK